MVTTSLEGVQTMTVCVTPVVRVVTETVDPVQVDVKEMTGSVGSGTSTTTVSVPPGVSVSVNVVV